MTNRPLLRSQKRDKVILDDFGNNDGDQYELVEEADPSGEIYADEINELPNETIDDREEINEERLSQSLRLIIILYKYFNLFEAKLALMTKMTNIEGRLYPTF